MEWRVDRTQICLIMSSADSPRWDLILGESTDQKVGSIVYAVKYCEITKSYRNSSSKSNSTKRSAPRSTSPAVVQRWWNTPTWNSCVITTNNPKTVLSTYKRRRRTIQQETPWPPLRMARLKTIWREMMTLYPCKCLIILTRRSPKIPTTRNTRMTWYEIWSNLVLSRVHRWSSYLRSRAERVANCLHILRTPIRSCPVTWVNFTITQSTSRKWWSEQYQLTTKWTRPPRCRLWTEGEADKSTR